MVSNDISTGHGIFVAPVILKMFKRLLGAWRELSFYSFNMKEFRFCLISGSGYLEVQLVRSDLI
jgi:hypothetical protein